MDWGSDRTRRRRRPGPAALAALALALAATAAACTPPPPNPGGPGTTTTTRPAPPTTVAPSTTTRPAPSTTVAPTTTTTTRPAPPTTTAPDPDPAPDFPGAVPAGSLRWGAAIDGNGNPVPRHEDPSGQPLALRRTFWRWDQRLGGMLNVIRDDLAHDRLPWVSLKPGGSWHDMGSGAFDAQIDELLRALDAVDGPVWLTIHHEPEGGGGVNAPDDPGGAPEWRNMQRRFRERMDAVGVDNVAFAPILMTWTWDTRSGRNPDDWWVPGIWDFYGVDHYTEEQGTLVLPVWQKVRRWVGDRGLPVAVGEWGMRGSDAAAGDRVRAWFDHAAGSATDGQGAQVIALSAFDSDLNSSTGGWSLEGGQLTAFQQLLGDRRTLDASEP
ncbi:MAG TPA: hypothetical protein VIL36_07180 [Acidimicrobiales bacterium]